MAELSTADPIGAPQDTDILPIRKGGVAGLLKITLLQMAAYIAAKLFPDMAGQAGKVLVVNDDEDGFEYDAVQSGGSSTSKAWWWKPPLAADFPTLLNADGTNVVMMDDPDLGLRVNTGPVTGGDDTRMAAKALPAGVNWSVTARLSVMIPSGTGRAAESWFVTVFPGGIIKLDRLMAEASI
jgi:hypothetical protein